MLIQWISILVSFASGILISYHEWWCGILLAGGFFLFYSWRFAGWNRNVLIWAVVLLLGVAYFQLRVGAQPLAANPGETTIKGFILDYPIQSEGKTRFRIKTEESMAQLKYLQVYCDFAAEVKRGQQVSLQGQVEVPNSAGNPGEFDHATHLRHQRIYYLISVEKPGDIQIIGKEQGVYRWLNSYREQIQSTLYAILPSAQADLLQGILLGAKENIEPSQYEMYQKTGIVHIFAVSGLHVGFLVLFFYFMTSLLAWSPGTRFFFITACLLAYGSLIGWPVSVQRAVIMAVLALLAQYQGRQGGLGNSLGLAGIVIVLLDPYALFTISFQLSFMATWGLVCLFPTLKEYIKYEKGIWDLVLIPFCAQLAVLPLIAYYFNLFSPVGLFSNIVISYLAGGIVLCGFAALLLVYLPSLAALFLYPAGFMLEILKSLTVWFNHLPGSYLWVKTPDCFTMAIYYGALLLLLAAWYYAWPRRWSFRVAFLLFCSLVIICLPPSLYKNGILEVVFLDVGQGDSILIKTPRGKLILLDGGGSHFYPVGERKVIPYLHHRGIRELYLIINSHPDSDHLLGLLETVRQIPFRYALLPRTLLDVKEYQELKEIAEQQNAVVLTAEAGQHINIEAGLEMEVLFPPVDLGSLDYNQHSLVLLCKYHQFSLLLPGDLGSQGLEYIAESTALENTLVLKVPHHGSGSSLSPAFYAELKPYAAVISVSKNNPHGHPSPEVVDSLEQQGVILLRTDRSGAITMESDGKTLSIKSFKK